MERLKEGKAGRKIGLTKDNWEKDGPDG